MSFFEIITPDTFFVALISIFSGTMIPLVRKYFKNLCSKLDLHNNRLELLEFIAINNHPNEYKIFKEMHNNES